MSSFRRTPGSGHRSRGTPINPTRRNPSGISPIASEAEREQALRDYKVTIEYKHLKQHAPGGVYLIPSIDNLRTFHGVIFVRRGPFTNGIFKFQVTLPERYNDANAWPQITFSSYVYNPHVNVNTGELDVRVAYPSWDPHRHYLVTVLTYLKKIFYMKNFGDDAVANVEARDLARSDPAAYRKKVESCVKESQRSVFVNDPGCTARFTEEQACHQVLRELMHERLNDPATLTKNKILEMVREANKSKSKS
mmetsp:Transcript_11915/g.16469  ORF Transcript_11915/g.16469 Transcript_11915/m.16469 type:complete len:250 (-) Transcript_11915:325-1074(-)|eukprot:CAMPEP_0185729636 /NCGR_PEP_ID=MMETSP1171-20130828/6722_1 /TAXON_ID=374046 /ORGANISM="Helicotheca tamensis, Strain CCMP826" /LENGTH=249 /DNA_ID=CAMNT_0028398523 /DNA_START=36 /DNA_END=785 /DNA_ORIENTATION=-